MPLLVFICIIPRRPMDFGHIYLCKMNPLYIPSTDFSGIKLVSLCNGLGPSAMIITNHKMPKVKKKKTGYPFILSF